MAGWLDDLLNPQTPADLRGLLGGFGMYTAPGPIRTAARDAEEEQRQAEEARAAAAARLAREMRPDRSGFTAGFPAAPDLYGQTSAFQKPQFAADPNAAPAAPDVPDAGATPVKTVSPEMINTPMPGDRSAPTVYFPPGAQASADLPTASAPTGGIAAPATQPEEHPLLKVGRGILQRLADNSNSLIAGGGAMMSGGLGKGFSAMAAASPLDIAYQQHRQANEATGLVQQALQQRGVPAAQARAMAIDPAFRKEMMPPGQHVTYTDAYGNQHLATFIPGPGGGRYVGPDGRPLETGAGGLGGGVQSQLPEGPDWFEKLPVEYQTEAKNYALGLNAGTANPRKGMPQMIKDIASKWATEHGLIIDENNLLQRRTMMNNIAKDQQGTTGGQLLFGRTAIHHLAEAAEGLTKLGNVSTGLAIPTEYANRIRGMTDEQKGKIDAANTALGKYGAEITKFYVGSGGTHGEREHNVAGLSSYSSPTGLAAVLEQEKKLIPGRLEEIGNHIRDTLGEAAYQKWYVNANKSLNTDLARIDNAIDTLRGGKGAASAVPDGKKIGETREFKQGTGVWNGKEWVPQK